MSREKKTVIPADATKVFEGVLFDVYQWQQQRFDGTYATFERLARPDTVQVLAVTEDGNIVLLNEEQPDRNPYLSLPGGRMEAGEDPREACLRELKEETGYVPQTCVLWSTVRPVSKMDWNVYTYIAKGCVKKSGQNLDAGEKISIREISPEAFLEIIFHPEFSAFEVTQILAQLLAEGKRDEALMLISK
ncbi:MAG: NUDIX hydrolase [Minisyncoccia bacterium]